MSDETASASSTPRLPTGPLVGATVRLDVSRPEDAAELVAALDDDRVWAAGYGGGPAARWRDSQQVASSLAALPAARGEGGRTSYTVRLAADSPLGPAGRVVGTTSLGDADLVNERIHLGWTAYSPAVWGSAVNPECKLLLLGHAFDDCGFGRVKIQTDGINARSQAAIAKLGATREGVLRRHTKRADGSFRDTVVFSVLREEWPQVREGLERRLAATRP
ncbi:MAG: GNAT family N-acetyltransferase [Actinomycetes bacterium]